jgi:serine/threonine-protein kinase HipA
MADLNVYMNGYKVGIFSREGTGAHMFQYVKLGLTNLEAVLYRSPCP